MNSLADGVAVEQSAVNRSNKRGRGKKSSPYLDARREWNAQFGSQVSAVRAWRLAAIISLLLALASIAGLLYLGARTKVIPYVVVIDSNGRTMSQGVANATTVNDQKVVRSLLSRFIQNLRFVTTDGFAQKNAIHELFTMISKNDASFGVISEHLQGEGDPFEVAKEKTVSVELSALLPISPTSWRVEWREVERTRQGQLIQRLEYQGQMTVRMQPQANPDDILKNPIGIFVTDLTWTRKL
ncbi:MAG: VirB8/TrbF family protein [Burkholderiaceae bacterium]